MTQVLNEKTLSYDVEGVDYGNKPDWCAVCTLAGSSASAASLSKLSPVQAEQGRRYAGH